MSEVEKPGEAIFEDDCTREQRCMNCGKGYCPSDGAPLGFCSYDCAVLAHIAIVNTDDWRL